MPSKGVETIMWDLFEYSGSPNVYLMYAAMLSKRKSRKEVQREEIEKMTR